MFTVAIYLIDRAYGGSEEGGWWYECGKPSDEHCEHTMGFDKEDNAIKYARSLDALCDQLNDGRPQIGHSNSKGRYWPIVSDGNPKPFPTTRPFYS